MIQGKESSLNDDAGLAATPVDSSHPAKTVSGLAWFDNSSFENTLSKTCAARRVKHFQGSVYGPRHLMTSSNSPYQPRSVQSRNRGKTG